MNWFTAFVLYVLIWWVVLFAVLPIGIRPAEEADSQTGWRGAPSNPRIGRKLLMTSLVTLALWGIAVAVIESPYLSFRNGWLALKNDP